MPLDLEEPGGGGRRDFPVRVRVPVPRCRRLSRKNLRETDGARDPGDRCGWSYPVSTICVVPIFLDE
jgi:hypothetical protein